MATVKLVEDYAISQARNSVRDSLQMHGERCVLLSMYHPFFDGDAPKCPFCTDDVYTESGQMCTICWGTGIQGGVKQAVLVWGLFTDRQVEEKYQQHGIWAADNREFQTEALPLLIEHDYVVRVRRWNNNHTPAEIEGYYGIQAVVRDSLRTGDRFGQTATDVVGQRASISLVSDATNIARYPVVGVEFSSASSTPALTPPPIVAPNMASVPPPGATKHAYTIGDGISTTITIDHYLGTEDVLVQLYDTTTGEQVDTNVYANTLSSVTLSFQDAPATDSLRAVIFA